MVYPNLWASMCEKADHNEPDDYDSDSGEQCPPDIMVCMLLPQPPRFSFITQPTKRRLPFGSSDMRTE